MKSTLRQLLSSLLIISFFTSLNAQDLPVNPTTRLVSIKDSISLAGLPVSEFYKASENWNTMMRETDSLYNLLGMTHNDGSVQVYMLFKSGATERKKNEYLSSGGVIYAGFKRAPLTHQVISADATNGTVTYTIYFSINSGMVYYEITSLMYKSNSDPTMFGKFEDEKPSKPWTIGVLSNNKKIWTRLRQEYFQRISTAEQNFKLYVQNYLAAGLKEKNGQHSKVCYEAYQKIKQNMAYDEVKEIIGEGKELSSTVMQIGGKSVVYQTFMFVSEENKSQKITISFQDGHVISKSQLNL